jgi:hypothetical protein
VNGIDSAREPSYRGFRRVEDSSVLENVIKIGVPASALIKDRDATTAIFSGPEVLFGPEFQRGHGYCS